jgi:hypothetical protein
VQATAMRSQARESDERSLTTTNKACQFSVIGYQFKTAAAPLLQQDPFELTTDN